MSWVVVVKEGDTVLVALGPREDRLQAVALSEVLRLSPDRKAYVVPIRDANAIDLHGPELLGELVEATVGERKPGEAPKKEENR